MASGKKLKLDISPTPEEEAAETFENEDDKKRAHEIKLLNIQNGIDADKRAQELKIVEAQQGAIGKVTGSCDPGFNFAYILAGIFGLVFIVFCIGFCFSDSFLEPLRYAGAALLTIAAYAFGKNA